MRDALNPQDGLYTLITKHGDGKIDYQVIGSIIGFHFAPDDPEAVLSRLVSPEIRIVSLTITEGGYSFDSVTGSLIPKLLASLMIYQLMKHLSLPLVISSKVCDVAANLESLPLQFNLVTISKATEMLQRKCS